MVVKRKNGIDAEMIYQDKACAVCKAELPVFKLPKDGLCSKFCITSNSKDVDVAFVHPVHKLDRSGVAAPHLKEGIGFIQDIIRGVDNSPSFLKVCMNDLGFWVVLVVRDGKGAEGSGVYKDLQTPTSPYRYLS